MKSKHSRPEEFVLEQLRALRADNKALRKRLRQLEKNKNVYENLKLDREADEEIERDRTVKDAKPIYGLCEHCQRNGTEEVELVGRIFNKCIHCQRTTIRKI